MELVPELEPTIAAFSVIVGMLASFVLFPARARITHARSARARRVWAGGGALTLAIGLWGTGNLALIGLQLPVQYGFEPLAAIAAVAPTTAFCLIALLVFDGAHRSNFALHVAALSLAAAMASIHHMLIHALGGDLQAVMQPVPTLLAVLMSYAAAAGALHVNRAAGDPEAPPWGRWIIGSVLIGTGLVAQHHFTIAATEFSAPVDKLLVGAAPAFPTFLAPAIGGAVLFVLFAFFIGSVIDSRLAEASSALKRSEATHRAVIANMLDALLIADAAGNIRALNPAAERLFGWTEGEVIGKPVTLLIRDGLQRRAGDTGTPAERLANHRRVQLPDGGLRRNGDTLPVELQVSPFHVDGECYYSCSVRDLSESWAAERKMRRLAAAIEQSGDAIAILDQDHRIQYVNPQYERQTGYSAVEIVGTRPSGGTSGEGHYSELWAAVDAGRTWSGQVRSRRRDGSVHDEELTVSPVIEESGEISGYVAVFRDVTRKLESERERQRMAEALHHSADSIEILDGQGRLVYMNAACERRTGYRLDDVRGCRPEALMDFTPAGDAYGDMVKTAVRQGQPWSGTLRSVGADGEEREEDVTVSPMRDDAGEVTAYVVVKRDTTVRRRLEAQAQQRRKLDSLSQLADGIARELSTPMQQLGDNLRFLRDSFAHLDRLLEELNDLSMQQAAIRPAVLAGCLQSADVEFLRREIREAVGQSQDSGEQLAGIVHAMRDLAQGNAQPVDLDLNRAIQSALTVTASEWRPLAELRTQFDAHLPALHCVPGQFSMAMMTLVAHATQSIAAANRNGLRGKGILSVTTRAAGGNVEIRVGHTGRAPAPEARAALLGTAAATGSGERQGLGVVHELIGRQLQGSIDIEHAAGDGPVIVVRIPLRRQGEQARHAATAA